jgi:hypothetical protein
MPCCLELLSERVFVSVSSLIGQYRVRFGDIAMDVVFIADKAVRWSAIQVEIKSVRFDL